MKGFGEIDNNQQKSKKNYTNAPNDNEKLISNAFRFQSMGNFNDAAKIYRHLIKIGIKDPRIFINLGGIYQQLKQYKEAIPLYEYASGLLGKVLITYSYRGIASLYCFNCW